MLPAQGGKTFRKKRTAKKTQGGGGSHVAALSPSLFGFYAFVVVLLKLAIFGWLHSLPIHVWISPLKRKRKRWKRSWNFFTGGPQSNYLDRSAERSRSPSRAQAVELQTFKECNTAAKSSACEGNLLRVFIVFTPTSFLHQLLFTSFVLFLHGVCFNMAEKSTDSLHQSFASKKRVEGIVSTTWQMLV